MIDHLPKWKKFSREEEKKHGKNPMEEIKFFKWNKWIKLLGIYF